MRLYGTTTSPFVRRVRIVATALGVPHQLISTANPEGEAELRRHTPLWKIPTAVFTEESGERVVWDSHAIVDYLVEQHGLGPFRPSAEDPWRETNLVNAIDGALEAAIHLFYLERDGLTPSAAPYFSKQAERVGSVMHWVESQLHGAHFFEDQRLGMAELVLLTTLDWMVFRKRYPVADHPRLVEFQKAHADWPGVRETYPTT